MASFDWNAKLSSFGLYAPFFDVHPLTDKTLTTQIFKAFQHYLNRLSSLHTMEGVRSNLLKLTSLIVTSFFDDLLSERGWALIEGRLLFLEWSHDLAPTIVLIEILRICRFNYKTQLTLLISAKISMLFSELVIIIILIRSREVLVLSSRILPSHLLYFMS